MSNNDSRILKHSAMVKNASPQMNGGGPHIQKQARPSVTTNDGLVVKRPAQGVARPVLKVRMDNGQPQREVEVNSNGNGSPSTREGVGTNKFGKRMILVRMDNGKPKRDTGRTPGGKLQRVALPGGKALNNDPRFAHLRQQRDQRQLASQSPSYAEPAPIAFAPSSGMSNEQLMLCRYAVKKYAEAESNELTGELCASTLKRIDALMAAQQGEPIEAAPEPAEVYDPGNDPEVETEPQDQAEPTFQVALAQQIEQNKLTPEQYAELEQFEQTRPKPRAQGVVRPFAARPPAKPAPIDTEPESEPGDSEPDSSKSE